MHPFDLASPDIQPGERLKIQSRRGRNSGVQILCGASLFATFRVATFIDVAAFPIKSAADPSSAHTFKYSFKVADKEYVVLGIPGFGTPVPAEKTG